MDSLNEQTLLDLKMGETYGVNASTEAMRVPGGWVYSKYHYDNTIGTIIYSCSTFVPEPMVLEPCYSSVDERG